MKELTGDLWEVEADARVITTNGLVKKDGRAVMGRGVAKQAAERYPWLPEWLGLSLRVIGNHVRMFLPNEGNATYLIMFPVKHNWWETANLDLIKRSAEELVTLIDGQFSKGVTIVLSRPGCGNGGLRWEDVKPVIEPLLDDRFVVVER